MGSSKRQVWKSMTKLFDLAILMFSFGVASLPHHLVDASMPFWQFLQIRIKLENFIVFAALLWLWQFIFSILGLYDSKRMVPRRAEAREVLKATTLCSVVLLLGSWLRFRMVTPTFVAMFWVVSSCIAVTSRVAVRTWLRRLRIHGRDSRNMLIVGSNHRAVEFAETIRSQPELGYKILGFADDFWAGVEELRGGRWSVVCNLESLHTFVRRSVVDEVVMALPLRSFHDLASEVAVMCEEQGIILRVLSDLFNVKHRPPIAEEFEGSPLITHYNSIEEGWPVVIKRGIDFTFSLLLLIALAPVLLLTAVLIKLTSPGPVFFVQKRIGLNKRIFNIFKFRTMVINAEEKLLEIEHLNEVSGPVFKIKNDPRITPVGKFLRKTSIDELPQLFNVLSGDMSLVGPRPLQLRDYELFTGGGEDWQRCRFSVRPGITCLWQVNGRSSLPFHRWMELDLQYVRTWSLWLDLQILAKTIPAVLRGSGAA